MGLHGEFDVGVLVVDVVEELVEVRCAVGPDDEGVVDVSKPKGRAFVGGLEGLVFEVLHEDVRDDGGEWGSHGCALELLVVVVAPLEGVGVEAGEEEVVDLVWSESCPVGEVWVGVESLFDDVTGLVDGDAGEEGYHIEADECVGGLKLGLGDDVDEVL